MERICEYNELKKVLAGLADDDYRNFSMKGIPSERPFIGVRIPLIREVVAKVPNEKIAEFLAVEPVAIEEVLARGMLICRLSYEEIVASRDKLHGKSWFDSQINYIDNWCTCDNFCSGMCRKIRKHREEFLELKVDRLLEAKDEFAVRAGLVILNCGYVSEDYLALIFDRVEGLAGREEYYIRMAIAWLIAECFVKYPEVTLAYMGTSRLPRWIFNKTISKICDSCRVDGETKKMLKKLDTKYGGTGTSQSEEPLGSVASERWRAYPLNYIYSGEYRDGAGYNRGNSTGMNSASNYTATSTYNLWVRAAGVSMTANNTSKLRGQTVRCLARDTIDITGNVHYEGNGGTGTVADQTNVNFATAFASNNQFTRVNYEFMGWNTNSNGSGVAVSEGGALDTAATTLHLSDGDTMTLYAMW